MDWAIIWVKSIPGRENSECKGSETETCLKCSRHSEKPGATGAEWVRRRVGGDEGGRRWRQIMRVFVGHSEDSGFCTEWEGNHWRNVSRKVIWSNLGVKMILWLLVLITGCGGEGEKQRDQGKSCFNNPAERWSWLGLGWRQWRWEVRSHMYVKERTYRICRRTGHRVCVRERRYKLCDQSLWKDGDAIEWYRKTGREILEKYSGVQFWTSWVWDARECSLSVDFERAPGWRC